MFLKEAVTVAASIVLFASADDPCQTPNGQKGNCVPINHCQSLFSHFERGLFSPSTATYLRKSNCGFLDGYPKVCCTIGSPVSPVSLLPDSCGFTTKSKIFGGKAADLDDFPWMALLEFQRSDGNRTFECGGSLINKRYVLTAAHCVLDALVSVRLGEYNIETDIDCLHTNAGQDCAEKVVNVGIEKKIIHRSYVKGDISHFADIALLRLEREIEYTDFIRPVCLPLSPEEISKSYVGENATVAGWGFTERGYKSSIKLYVNVPVKDLSHCNSGFKTKFKLDIPLRTGQICAGGEKGKDSCRADSGGPLMILKLDENRDVRYYVIGVVSFGATICGQEDVPGVYTKVGEYVKWILENLEP